MSAVSKPHTGTEDVGLTLHDIVVYSDYVLSVYVVPVCTLNPPSLPHGG